MKCCFFGCEEIPVAQMQFNEKIRRVWLCRIGLIETKDIESIYNKDWDLFIEMIKEGHQL